ncbi:MAG TPA: lipoate--protein ligase LplA, partial [Psychrobacter pasteurii]|nr:lipoate--protein ligase LplA [Psychrobacter pasteurii]
KGIKSVRSRVANLVDFNETVTHESLSEAIIEAFCEYYGQTVEVEELDEASLKKEPHLNKYYEQMADWIWRFGKTPAFSHHIETRFDWGIIDLHLDVQQAVITDVVIFSDALNVELIDELKQALIETKYTITDVKAKLETLKVERADLADQVSGFEQWLVSEMET